MTAETSSTCDKTVMLAAALQIEFETTLRADAGNRYSAAMMARGLMILQRQLAGQTVADCAAALSGTSCATETALAQAIRARRLTAAQQAALPQALEALVAAKLALTAPDEG